MISNNLLMEYFNNLVSQMINSIEDSIFIVEKYCMAQWNLVL